MMIDSVVWAQYINVTDRHTDSHVAVANAAPTHCVGRQKPARCMIVTNVICVIYNFEEKRVIYAGKVIYFVSKIILCLCRLQTVWT